MEMYLRYRAAEGLRDATLKDYRQKISQFFRRARLLARLRGRTSAVVGRSEVSGYIQPTTRGMRLFLN